MRSTLVKSVFAAVTLSAAVLLMGVDTCSPAPVEPVEDPAEDPVDEPTECLTSADCAEGLYCQGVPAYTDEGSGCCLDVTRVPGEGEMCTGDVDCAAGLVCILDSCSPEWMAKSFAREPGLAIPDADWGGVSDTILVSCLATVPVTVDADVVIRHERPEDLIVKIVDPSGDIETTLAERELGDGDVLRIVGAPVHHTGDDAVNGPWTLQVIDAISGATPATGTLESWNLHLTSRWD